jgi:hypothetical protein
MERISTKIPFGISARPRRQTVAAMAAIGLDNGHVASDDGKGSD